MVVAVRLNDDKEMVQKITGISGVEPTGKLKEYLK